MTTTPKRRWFQFSLRAVLIVVTLLCIGPGGYVAYEQRKARREKTAVEAIEKLGGIVEYDQAMPVRSATMRQILGNDAFGNVSRLILTNEQVADADLVHLAELKKLTDLSLDYTQVTDAGLVHLAGLNNIRYLSLENTKVSGLGLVHLAGLKNLEMLDLDHTQTTDAGLVHLAGLTKLTYLRSYDTQVTAAGIAELQKALPGCDIEW